MEKRIYKKFILLTQEGNVIINSSIIGFANARKYSEETLRRLTFKYLEKVAEFSIPSFFYGVILRLVLDKAFL